MHQSVPVEPISKNNRPFNVYLATGSTVRITTARLWIERLQAKGFSVYDWTRDPNWDRGWELSEAQFVESALRDEAAIRECDLFWYVVPEEKSEGAASELMLAKCRGKTIVGSGRFGARNIFALTSIPKELRFSSEQAAFSVICDIAEKAKRFRGEF